MLFAVATAAGGQAFSKLVSAAFPCSGTISEVLLLYLLLIGGRSPACFRACPATRTVVDCTSRSLNGTASLAANPEFRRYPASCGERLMTHVAAQLRRPRWNIQSMCPCTIRGRRGPLGSAWPEMGDDGCNTTSVVVAWRPDTCRITGFSEQ